MAPKRNDLGIRPATRRSIRAWTAITLLAASAGLITACGASPAGLGPAGLVPGLPEQDQAAQANGGAGAQAPPLDTQILGAYFPATARQYAAGAQLSGRIYSLQSRITAACMAKHGFTSPTVSTSAAAARIWDLSQFPNIAWMKQTGLMVPILNMTSARLPAVPPGKEQAYRADLSGCSAGQMTVPGTGVIRPGPDRHWGGVFARCAQNLATLYEKLQVAAQAQFFRRHYQQIHQLEEQVSRMLVSAEQLIKADSAG